MADDVSAVEVGAVLSRLGRAARRCGALDADAALVLEHGSPGVEAWRLYRRGEGGALFDVFGLGNGFLGWSRREALSALRFLADGMEAAVAAANRKGK